MKGSDMHKRDHTGNRDWFSAPLQGGGRGAYDYGRTPIHPAKPAWDLRSAGFAFFCVVMAISGMVFSGVFS